MGDEPTPAKLQLMFAGFETELPHKPRRAGQVSLVSTEAVSPEAFTLSSLVPSPLCPGERPGLGDREADLSFTSRVLHFQGHAARQRAYPWLLPPLPQRMRAAGEFSVSFTLRLPSPSIRNRMGRNHSRRKF